MLDSHGSVYRLQVMRIPAARDQGFKVNSRPDRPGGTPVGQNPVRLHAVGRLRRIQVIACTPNDTDVATQSAVHLNLNLRYLSVTITRNAQAGLT